jgi:hypothetical protein
MARNYDAKNMLLGVLHDANNLVLQGKTKQAVFVLKRKIIEIEKIEKCDYANVTW